MSPAPHGAYAPPFSGGAYFRENVESYRAKSAIAGRGASLPCRGGPPPDSVFLFVQMLCQECLVGSAPPAPAVPLEAAGVVLNVLAQRPLKPVPSAARWVAVVPLALPAVQQQLAAVQPCDLMCQGQSQPHAAGDIVQGHGAHMPAKQHFLPVGRKCRSRYPSP